MSLPAPIDLRARSGSGSVYLHGAHLTAWVPEGQEPVLWLSSFARFEPGTAIRGGVPIIFPWFGAGRPGNLAPAHGFARTSPWELESSEQDGDDVVAVLTLAGDDTLPAFPFRYGARYEIRLGRTLQLSLTIENKDVQVFSFEEALHTYLAVGDVRSVRVEGLDGCAYFDQAPHGGPVHAVQEGAVSFDNETDRIYSSSGQLRVVDPVRGRVLVIDRESSANAVVWNPWVDKARRMDDFGDDEWPSMLCIEGANVRENAVEISPGQSHRMSYSVRVEPL